MGDQELSSPVPEQSVSSTASRGRVNRKIAVTGASSGIGRGIALLFAQEGADVVCADIDPNPPHMRDPATRQTNGEYMPDDRQIGPSSDPNDDRPTHLLIQDPPIRGRSIFVRTDVRRSADVENLVQTTVQHFGRLDIFVNNAGIFLENRNPQPIWAMPDEWWDETQSVNARGVFLGCKHASAQMIRQEPVPGEDRGTIINIASVLGLVGRQDRSAYSASKGAVISLTRAVSKDCAELGIRVNAISPGYVATPQNEGLLDSPNTRDRIINEHPYRGLGIPDDIARVALLFSEPLLWVTGQNLAVDGGYTVGRGNL